MVFGWYSSPPQPTLHMSRRQQQLPVISTRSRLFQASSAPLLPQLLPRLPVPLASSPHHTGRQPPKPARDHLPQDSISQLLLCPSSAKAPSVPPQRLTVSYCSHLFMVYFCKPSSVCVMKHSRAPIDVWITAGLRDARIPPDTPVLHYRHSTQGL